MASIKTGIELNDQFSNVLNNIIYSVNEAVSAMYDMNESMNADIDTSSLESAKNYIDEATVSLYEMDEAAQNLDVTQAEQSFEGLDQKIQKTPSHVDDIRTSMQGLNSDIQDTNTSAGNLNGTLMKAAGALLSVGSVKKVSSMISDAMDAYDTQLNAETQLMSVLANGLDNDYVSNFSVNTNTDVTADTSEAMASVNALADLTESLPENVVVDVDANTSEAAEAVTALTDINSMYIDVTADTSEAMASVNALADLADNISDVSMQVSANTKKATKSLADLTSLANNVTLSVTADTEEALEAVTEITNMNELIIDVTAETADALNAVNALKTDTDVILNVETDTLNAANDIAALSDQTVTVQVTAETAALQSEFDQIVAKASEIQSMGIYGDEAMIAGAAELATYFTDVEAITTMMDTLTNYAMGMTGGGAVDAKAMTDYATNLGKIMTGSYDAMTKKGFEFNDAQKAIIEGEATEQQIVQQLGAEYLDCSDDMRAAAAITQVIDESWAGLYQTMSNTPEGQIIQLNNAFGDMQETIAGELYPYVLLFVQIIEDNWSTIEQIVDGITGALQTLMGVLGAVMDVAFTVAQVIIDNWSYIEPIISAIAAALALYYGIQLVVNTATNIWNAICNANPMVFILMAIVVAIAAVSSAIARMSSTTSSAFGVITGSINVAIQFFKNLGLTVADIALGIVNAIGALCTNIQAAFHNSIANVQIFFYNLLSTALDVVAQIANALNKLPFVSFDVEGLASAADAYADKAAELEASKYEYASISDAFNEGFSKYDTFADGWISDAYASGAAWGDNIADSISDALNFDTSAYSLSAADFTNSLTSAINNSDISDALGDLSGASGRTADNTGAIVDALDISNDQLAYLRDIAEQEAINRYTLATVNIDQSGMTNQINSGDDIDSFMTQLTDAVNEAVDTMTEGVHT